MNRVILCALAALSLLPFAPSARAQSRSESYDPHKAFQESDKNHDGYIEISEFTERLNDVFFLGDKNKDGKLSKEEYDDVVVTTTVFASVDKNGDGFISESEFVTSRMPLFQQTDKDHDGKLSESEVTSAYQANKK